MDRPNPTPDDLKQIDGTMTPETMPATVTPMDLEEARAWMQSDLGAPLSHLREGILDGVVGGVGDLIRGIVRPGFERHEPVANAQLDLIHRTDLLEGVSGYGAAYMSRNIRLDWAFFQENWRTMPFDAQIGPAHNVTVQEDGRLRLDGVGAWTIYARVLGNSTSFGGNGQVRMDVIVRGPNGEDLGMYYRTEATSAISVDWAGQVTNKGNVTVTATIPVVVAQSGCTVEVRTWSAAWRRWQGGTATSLLAALRHSTDTNNPGQSEVRDETEQEAEEDTP